MGRTTSTLTSQRTSFLVPDIHCASCTLFIDDLLSRLRPAPSNVESSIVSHAVTIDHGVGLSAKTVAQTLGAAGYEVTWIDPPLQDNEKPSRGGGPAFLESIRRVYAPWHRFKQANDETVRYQRHMEHCAQCRAEKQNDEHQKEVPCFASSEDAGQTTLGELPLIAVGDISSEAPPRFRASLSVSGMSCSSCVGKIEGRLRQFPWAISANVSLLSQSVTVDFEGQHDIQELVAAVDELGYEATLQQVERTNLPSNVVPSPESGLWKAAYAIEGMTCSSCVGAITEALSKLGWVKSVDVNLVTNSATVVLEDKSQIDEVCNVIDDLGYGARLNNAEPVDSGRQVEDHRTVLIKIDGMYCQHCPDRITDAIARLDRAITIEAAPTMQNPRMTITYQPRPPDFTVRDIILAISNADAEFQPKLYHPPSLAESARQMQLRQRRRLFQRVLLSFIVAIPTFVIGVVYMSLVPEINSSRQYLQQRLRGVPRAEWALLVMATPVYFFAADIFHRRAAKELFHLWKPGSKVPILRRLYRFGSMDMLLSLGTSIAYWASLADLIVAATRPSTSSDMLNLAYFDSVVFLTMFLLFGRLIEAYTKAKTGEAVRMIGNLRPTEALLAFSAGRGEGSDRTKVVDAHLLDSGDVIQVPHGGSAAWDGLLVEGEGQFDESSLTGESRLVKKSAGDAIYAGTINLGASVSVRITGASGNSMLDKIIQVVEEGQVKRAPIERVADVLTAYFVPFVIFVAIVTWLVWLALGVSGSLPNGYKDIRVGGWTFWALQFPIAVLVIACPCGIGLAAPTALFVGGGIAAKHGILVKGGGEAFQEASNLDVVVFDKTGTLTQGSQPQITDHRILTQGIAGWSCDALLNGVRDLESNSSHPLAQAMVAFCARDFGGHLQTLNAGEAAGKGMKGSFALLSPLQPTTTIDIVVGNETMMAQHGVTFDGTVSALLHMWESQANSVVLVAAKSSTDTKWTPFGIFAASDPLRPEARDVVEAIGRQSIDVWMISGDNPTTARAIGATIGIPPERIIGGVLPDQKAEKIKYLQQSQTGARRGLFGRSDRTRATVAMVGDGINDSPALAVADVGIAIGSGSDVAISAAAFVLVNADLRTLLQLITLSRAVFRRVKLNFAWAFIYNLLALPVAAGVLYPIVNNGAHVRLDPVWASLAMALSSISVVCSSLLLRSGLPLVGFRQH